MPLTEKEEALTEEALEPFGDDRETASMTYVRDDVFEFDANAGESRRRCAGCDGTRTVNDELQSACNW